jgi:hypothetical protein
VEIACEALINRLARQATVLQPGLLEGVISMISPTLFFAAARFVY